MATTGKPGESAMARAEAQRGVSSSGGLAASTRDGGFAGAGNFGGGSGGGLANSTRDGGFQSAGNFAIGNRVAANQASPMSIYGDAFDFTPQELTASLMSMNKAGLPGAGLLDLMSLRSALQKPQNIAMSEALGGPLVAYQNEPTPNFSLPSGVLGGAFGGKFVPTFAHVASRGGWNHHGNSGIGIACFFGDRGAHCDWSKCFICGIISKWPLQLRD